MDNQTENKIECIGCQSYYLYYSRKNGEYKITKSSLEAFDNGPWIDLRDEKVSDLIKILQNHESVLEKNKANLSAEGIKGREQKVFLYEHGNHSHHLDD